MFEAGLRVDVHEVVPPRSGPGSNEGEDAAAEVPTLNLIVDSCAGNLEESHVTAYHRLGLARRTAAVRAARAGVRDQWHDTEGLPRAVAAYSDSHRFGSGQP